MIKNIIKKIFTNNLNKLIIFYNLLVTIMATNSSLFPRFLYKPRWKKMLQEYSNHVPLLNRCKSCLKNQGLEDFPSKNKCSTYNQKHTFIITIQVQNVPIHQPNEKPLDSIEVSMDNSNSHN